MKILFFIESLHGGGKERRLVELIKGLKKKNLNIVLELVLIHKGISYPEIRKQKVKIHYTERKHFRKDPVVFLIFLKLLKNSNQILFTYGVICQQFMLFQQSCY
jgi:hypothetical protein